MTKPFDQAAEEYFTPPEGPEGREMDQLEGCIRFWEPMLENNRFIMSVSTISQMEATIKFLKELQQIKSVNQTPENSLS